jgi:hypothetical protein
MRAASEMALANRRDCIVSRRCGAGTLIPSRGGAALNGLNFCGDPGG